MLDANCVFQSHLSGQQSKEMQTTHYMLISHNSMGTNPRLGYQSVFAAQWVTAVIRLSVQMFKYRLPNFLFGMNLVAIWKGLSKILFRNCFSSKLFAFIPTPHFQQVDRYFGKNWTKDVARFAFHDSLSLTNIQGNMTSIEGSSGSIV